MDSSYELRKRRKLGLANIWKFCLTIFVTWANTHAHTRRKWHGGGTQHCGSLGKGINLWVKDRKRRSTNISYCQQLGGTETLDQAAPAIRHWVRKKQRPKKVLYSDIHHFCAVISNNYILQVKTTQIWVLSFLLKKKNNHLSFPPLINVLWIPLSDERFCCD